MFKRFLLLLALLFSANAWALPTPTTYTYTGQLYVSTTDYTVCTVGTCANYTTAMRLSGSFVAAAALAPNLTMVDIGPGGTNEVASFSFSDGVNTYASGNTETQVYQFLVSTDAYGDLSDASIIIYKWQTGVPGAHVNGDRGNLMLLLGSGLADIGRNNYSCDNATTGSTCASFSSDASSSDSISSGAGQWASNHLASLSISAGTLSPAFDEATSAYTATVPYCTSSVTLTPTLVDTLGSVTVNGVATTSGSASAPVALSVGSNAIPVVVTGSDSSTRIYSVAVTRQAQVADHFAVSAPGTAAAGQSVNVTVTAQDACGSNTTVTGYAGIVHLTSSDGTAILPSDNTLASGTGTFTVTFGTVGNQTVTATDTVTASITGTSGTVAVGAAQATHFSVSAPAGATAGTPVTVTVTALDAGNGTVTGYTGTVHITSSDGAATLPANATLTSGTGSFAVTLRTTGNQTVTATDTVTSSITGTSGTITVAAAVPVLAPWALWTLGAGLIGLAGGALRRRA